MIEAQNAKYVNSVVPVLKDNGDLIFVELDTLGWNYLEVLLFVGITDIAIVTAMKLTESEAAGSGHVDIAGTLWTTALDIAGAATVFPTATDDGKIFKWELDLRKRMRYIDAVITIGDGTNGMNACVVSRLSRGETMPDTAAEAGCQAIVRL